MIKYLFKLGNVKPEVIRSALPTEARSKSFIEKTGSKARTLFDWL